MNDLNAHIGKSHPAAHQGEVPQSQPEPTDSIAVCLVCLLVAVVAAFLLCATDAAWPLIAALTI